MAAAVAVQPVQSTYQRSYRELSAGRSTFTSNVDLPYPTINGFSSSTASLSSWQDKKIPSRMDYASRSSTTPNMGSQSTSQQSESKRRHRRLSKIGPSNTSSIEPFPSFTSAPPRKGSSSNSGSKPKINPFHRKMSGSKSKEDADQGRLDLSKSMSENAALSALDSQDLSPRSTSEAVFAPPSRSNHARTLSGGSQVSAGSASGSHRTFVHPMRQTPRPYTPATGTASPISSEEAEENALAKTDERVDQISIPNYPSRQIYGRMGRSQSIISTTSTTTLPMIAPTPLSHVQTAPDLDYITQTTTPAIPGFQPTNNNSTANLSTHSTKSSSRSRLVRRLRGDTSPAKASNISIPIDRQPSAVVSPVTATTSRSSLDKTFSLTSATRSRSDSLPALDSRVRDERVQAARRAFVEKEASKERKSAAAATSSTTSRRGTNGSSARDESGRRSRKGSLGLAGKSSPDLLARTIESGSTRPHGRSRRGSSGLSKLSQETRQSVCDLKVGGCETAGVDGEEKLLSRAYVDAVPAEKPVSGRDLDVYGYNHDEEYDDYINNEGPHHEGAVRKAKDVGFVSQKEIRHGRSSKRRNPQRGHAKPDPQDFEVENKGLNGWVRFSAWAKTRMLHCGDGGRATQRNNAAMR